MLMYKVMAGGSNLTYFGIKVPPIGPLFVKVSRKLSLNVLANGM